MQGDFGQAKVELAGEKVRLKVHLGVVALGFSRRPYIEVFESERAEDWFRTFEGACNVSDFRRWKVSSFLRLMETVRKESHGESTDTKKG